MPWEVDEALRRDAALIDRLRHPDRTLEKIEKVARDAVADNFAGEWDGAQHWKQLAPSTQEDRARKGYGPAHPILQRSGELASTIDYRHNVGIGVATLEIEPRAAYAAVQQDGSADGKIPARPFLAFSDRDLDTIGELVLDLLEDE